MTRKGELREFRLREIRWNRFRNLSTAPLISTKIDELRKSINDTGFWNNVLVRALPDGTPELIFGHHRIEAARQELGDDAIVRLEVWDVDDSLLFRMMVNDNREAWRHDVRTELAAVASLVEAYAGGRLLLTAPPDRTKHSDLRYAPSFLKGGPDDSETFRNDRPYTARSVADYLGWDQDRAGDLLNTLELIERGIMEIEPLSGLSHAQARRVTLAARKLLAGDPEAASAVAKIIASGFRSGDMSYRDAERLLAAALKDRSDRDLKHPAKGTEKKNPEHAPTRPPAEHLGPPHYRPYPFDQPSLYIDQAKYFIDTMKAARPLIARSGPDDVARIRAVHEELKMVLGELDGLLPRRAAA